MEIIALVAIFLIAVALQGWVFNKFSPSRLEYKCEFSVTQAFEGDDIFLVETVYNKKLLPVPWIKVDIHTSRWLDFAGTTSVVAQENRRVTSSFFLKSYQKTTRRWKLKCLKRGIFTIENVTLIWGDLLGLNNSSAPVHVGANLVVYPGIVNLEDMFMPANYLQGDTVVKRWIIDDPFIVSGSREYTPGDPMNRIHWSATAKEGRLMIRKNDFTSNQSLTVILNIQSMEFEYNAVVNRDMAELGIKAAATILDEALRVGAPVRLGTNAITIDGDRQTIFTGKASGTEHVGELLKILARLELKNVRDFEVFLDGIAADLENTEIILITCYLNKGICELSRKLKAQRNAVKVILLDPLTDVKDLPRDIDIYIFSGSGDTDGK